MCVVGLAMATPFPEDAAAPVVLPYGLGAYALPYAGIPVLYHPLESGLVYPVAEAYVHDATGDESDNSYPEAEDYVHDASGDA